MNHTTLYLGTATEILKLLFENLINPSDDGNDKVN